VIVKWKLPSYLRQDQVKAFFSVVTSSRDKALFLTIYLYGLRVSEACLLQREDVDLERRTIRMWRVKNGYSGEKPLFRALAPILKRYLRTRTDDNAALFVGRQGRLTKRWVQALFTRYAVLANFAPPRRHVHLLRHSIATHLLDAGEPIDFVQDHLGHRNIESSLVYARVSDRRRSKAISRLERSREIALPA
jgi:type 1 fimbriae regulatory protein FimB